MTPPLQSREMPVLETSVLRKPEKEEVKNG